MVKIQKPLEEAKYWIKTTVRKERGATQKGEEMGGNVRM